MSSRRSVALFVDLENIRYSLLNNHEVEPDILALMDSARKHGRVMVALAYADFRRHPLWLGGQVDTAGITARDIPMYRVTKANPQGDTVRFHKSPVDSHMIMDIVETAEDRPGIRTFILATGDRDFTRTVTWLRHRHEKTVIVLFTDGGGSTDLTSHRGDEVPEEVE